MTCMLHTTHYPATYRNMLLPSPLTPKVFYSRFHAHHIYSLRATYENVSYQYPYHQKYFILGLCTSNNIIFTTMQHIRTCVTKTPTTKSILLYILCMPHIIFTMQHRKTCLTNTTTLTNVIYFHKYLLSYKDFRTQNEYHHLYINCISY